MPITSTRLVRKAECFLSKEGIEDARISSEEIMCSVLGFASRSDLFLNTVFLKREKVKNFIAMVRQRAKRYPLQYIVHEAGFMKHVFWVCEDVLIPRPETELLVEEICNSVRFLKQPAILDIGTGSGCIAISIASEGNVKSIVAIDISEKALLCATENARRIGVSDRVRFLLSDCFTNVPRNEQFDIIVSNPPYIRRRDLFSLQKEVHFEPQVALDGGVDGLDFYIRIIREAPRYMKSGGMIFFEIGYDQANAVVELLKQNGFYDCLIIKDLAGHDRIVRAQKA